MRKSLVLATLVVLACSAAAFAGVPDPSRSGCAVVGNPLPCQFRFRADGALDKLTLKVTLRDAFDAPVANCSTYCNLGGATLAANNCGGNRKGGLTNAGGVVNFIYRCIGGRGSVNLLVTAVCSGNIGICSRTIAFTNPDLDGSSQATNSTTVADLGLWAAGLSSYVQTSDFDCNGTVNVADLGLWASGLNKGCSLCP